MRQVVEAGKQFGRLTVVGLARVHQRPSGVRTNVWRCTCDCGEAIDVFAGNLTNRVTRSCGCLQRETASRIHTTHGMTDTIEFKTWNAMIGRCYRTSHRFFSHYGGRGIAVCDSWRNSFESFLRDMGTRPGAEYSIDRVDNNGPYSKENCRWATQREQCNNTRRNVHLTVNGVTHTLKEWSRLSGIYHGTIVRRIRNGWTPEDAIATPPKQKRSSQCL